jgi:hypothetical protein
MGFIDQSHYLSFRYLLDNLHEPEQTLFQAHCFTENLIAPRIKPGISGFVARNCDHWTTEAVLANKDVKQKIHNEEWHLLGC